MWLRGKMDKLISSLIKGKNKLYSIAPETTVYAALELMAEKNVGFLVVLDGETMKGVVSERDIARKVDLLNKNSRTTAIREIMVCEVETILPTQTYDEAMSIMAAKHIRHLPVVNEGRVLTVISMGDVVKTCMRNQKETIEFLQDIALDK